MTVPGLSGYQGLSTCGVKPPPAAAVAAAIAIATNMDSVVLVRGDDVAGLRVDLHVVRAHVDVPDEPAVAVLEVDLVQVARRGGLGGGDCLLLADLRLRQQVLAVVEPRAVRGRRLRCLVLAARRRVRDGGA